MNRFSRRSGLETISKDHFEFDPQLYDDKSPITDFDPDQSCLFCLNRQELLANRKSTSRTTLFIDDDENAPLDLSIKSNSNPSRSNVK